MTAREGAAKRRSIRLAGYDYAQPGAYFVTVCTQARAPLLAEIVNGELRMNAAGKMIEHWWQRLPSKFDKVELDAFVVMPDHVHGIIVLLGDDHVGAAPCGRPLSANADDSDTTTATGYQMGGHAGPPLPQRGGAPLSRVVAWYKTMTTNDYIRNVRSSGWMPFDGRLWQRNYYEHIVRSEDALNRLRRYVEENPANWHTGLDEDDVLAVVGDAR
ncbi:MAG: transposase [Dehalococcoidia bacterium]